MRRRQFAAGYVVRVTRTYRYVPGRGGNETNKPASKWVGDCYLLAYAKHCQAPLVTFDTALHALARKQDHFSVIPG